MSKLPHPIKWVSARYSESVNITCIIKGWLALYEQSREPSYRAITLNIIEKKN